MNDKQINEDELEVKLDIQNVIYCLKENIITKEELKENEDKHKEN